MSRRREPFPFRSHRTLQEVQETKTLRDRALHACRGRPKLTKAELARLEQLTALERQNNP